MMEQTIFALSTGQVRAAVAIIRVSGPLAREAARLLCSKELVPRRAELVDFKDPKTAEVLDRGLVIWFPSPHSYTGEDVLEFQSHGGLAVTTAILTALADVPGIRLAEPGEFTRRAFQNGKMGLDSVEGLADLLAADTQIERRRALHNIQGNLGGTADRWRCELVEVRALIEAGLDFVEEGDVPSNIQKDVIERIDRIFASVAATIQQTKRQSLLGGGFIVLIAGPPNAGKSSLLNCLVQKEVAITSETAGTTRDLIEVSLELNGMKVVLIDSAGLRNTDDPVEKIGLARALSRAREANLVLWLGDELERNVPKSLVESGAKIIVLRGKSDLHPSAFGGLSISPLTGSGVEDLLDVISLEAKVFFDRFEGLPTLRQRQLSVANELLECLQDAKAHATSGSYELCAEELGFSARCLGVLVEEVSSADVLDEVFSRFCLGK